MSNFTITYDSVIARLSALFPNKSKLPNPYVVEDNGSVFLEDSFGLRIGDADGLEGEFVATVDDQVFEIVLTEEAKGQEMNPAVWEQVGKSLKDDTITIRKDFLNGDFIQQSSNIDRIDYLSTTGIELVGDSRKYLQITLTLSFRISESLK